MKPFSEEAHKFFRVFEQVREELSSRDPLRTYYLKEGIGLAFDRYIKNVPGIVTIPQVIKEPEELTERIKELEQVINGALRCRDLWGNPDDLSHVEEAHKGEVQMLAAMESEFRRVINKESIKSFSKSVCPRCDSDRVYVSEYHHSSLCTQCDLQFKWQ